MIQYVQADLLAQLCAEPNEPNLGTLLVEVVASVLDNEVSLSRPFSNKQFQNFNPQNWLRKVKASIDNQKYFFAKCNYLKCFQIDECRAEPTIETEPEPLPPKNSENSCNEPKKLAKVGAMMQSFRQRQMSRYILPIGPTNGSSSASTSHNNWSSFVVKDVSWIFPFFV